jgi:Spy/CpxP family protein refolding chaperone
MMTRKTGWGLAGVLLAAMALAAPLALSQSQDNPSGSQRGRGAGFSHRHRGMRAMGGWEFRRLNLTDEQKTQIQQIRKSHFETTAPVRDQIRTLMTQFRESMKQDTFDEAAATQKLTEIAPLRAKLMADRIKMRQEMNAVLTPEQKAQLEQFRQRAETRRENHRNRKTQSPQEK